MSSAGQADLEQERCNKQNSARDSHVAPGRIKVHVSVIASNAMHLFCRAPRSKRRLNSILSWKEIHFDAAKARELNAVDLYVAVPLVPGSPC